MKKFSNVRIVIYDFQQEVDFLFSQLQAVLLTAGLSMLNIFDPTTLRRWVLILWGFQV